MTLVFLLFLLNILWKFLSLWSGLLWLHWFPTKCITEVHSLMNIYNMYHFHQKYQQKAKTNLMTKIITYYTSVASITSYQSAAHVRSRGCQVIMWSLSMEEYPRNSVKCAAKYSLRLTNWRIIYWRIMETRLSNCMTTLCWTFSKFCRNVVPYLSTIHDYYFYYFVPKKYF